MKCGLEQDQSIHSTNMKILIIAIGCETLYSADDSLMTSRIVTALTYSSNNYNTVRSHRMKVKSQCADEYFSVSCSNVFIRHLRNNQYIIFYVEISLYKGKVKSSEPDY